jgi:hypothetical protein
MAQFQCRHCQHCAGLRGQTSSPVRGESSRASFSTLPEVVSTNDQYLGSRLSANLTQRLSETDQAATSFSFSTFPEAVDLTFTDSQSFGRELPVSQTQRSSRMNRKFRRFGQACQSLYRKVTYKSKRASFSIFPSVPLRNDQEFGGEHLGSKTPTELPNSELSELMNTSLPPELSDTLEIHGLLAAVHYLDVSPIQEFTMQAESSAQTKDHVSYDDSSTFMGYSTHCNSQEPPKEHSSRDTDEPEYDSFISTTITPDRSEHQVPPHLEHSCPHEHPGKRPQVSFKPPKLNPD